MFSSGTACQLGHDAALTLSTYGHVIDELEDAPRLEAERAIAQGPRAGCAQVAQGRIKPPGGISPGTQKPPRLRGVSCEALARTRTVDPFLTMEVLYQLSYEGARTERIGSAAAVAATR